MDKGQYGYIKKNIEKNNYQYYYAWNFDSGGRNPIACYV